MDKEQIIQMVKEHFEEDWDDYDGWEYSGKMDVFIKFAQAIYDKGREDESILLLTDY